MISKKRPNLDQSRHSGVVAMAVPWLHVEICSGAHAPHASGLNSLDLGRLGTLRIEEALAGYIALGGGDHAPEVGMRGGEASGLIGQLHRTLDVRGLERMVSVGVVDSGLADNRRPPTVSS